MHQWFIGEIQAVHMSDSYIRDEVLTFWGGEYRTAGSFIEKSRQGWWECQNELALAQAVQGR